MSERGGGVMSRLYARVRALLPEDWRSRAGRRFRDTTEAVSRFTEEHQVRPKDIAHEGVELVRSALHGKANVDLAAAMKGFAETEHIKIDTELQKRSAPADVRKKEAEAHLAELEVLHREADLLEKLQRLGVTLRRDEYGNPTVLPAPADFDLRLLTERRLKVGAAAPQETPESRTFIGYSSKDQQFADRLCADLQAKGLRCWFAPHDLESGQKLHERIDAATRVHEKLLLVLSPQSINSEWVKTEIAKARKREMKEGRRMLFPILLGLSFSQLQEWECFDADTGEDSAREVREYFIPDFSNWKDHDAYQVAFKKLLEGLHGGAES